MKPLAEHMGMYSAYHRHPMNRVIHFIFVPAIVWTLMVWLDLIQFDVAGSTLSVAMFVTAALLVWYLMLDFTLGVASVVVFTMLLVSAITMNVALGAAASAWIAGGVFVGSWVFQFVGHGVWEKRRPALFDNLFQTLIAPMFLIAETAFAFGMKKKLRDEVHGEMKNHLPARTKGATV
jgi:uncharacterized membrane protein YGL010W